MSERIETYAVFQRDGEDYWRWAYLVDDEEYDRGIADDAEEAMKEAHRNHLLSRDYECVSEAAEFVEDTICNGGTVILEPAVSEAGHVVRVWFDE